jgi:hypothetical protein
MMNSVAWPDGSMINGYRLNLVKVWSKMNYLVGTTYSGNRPVLHKLFSRDDCYHLVFGFYRIRTQVSSVKVDRHLKAKYLQVEHSDYFKTACGK